MVEIAKQTNLLKRGNPAWKKGVSGNPNGRKPNGLCLTSLVKEYLHEHPEGQKWTYAQALARAMIAKALKGDVRMMELIWERVDGKVTQTISGPDGGPIKVSTAQELTDEELAVIVAQRTIANARRSGSGAANSA